MQFQGKSVGHELRAVNLEITTQTIGQSLYIIDVVSKWFPKELLLRFERPCINIVGILRFAKTFFCNNLHAFFNALPNVSFHSGLEAMGTQYMDLDVYHPLSKFGTICRRY